MWRPVSLAAVQAPAAASCPRLRITSGLLWLRGRIREQSAFWCHSLWLSRRQPTWPLFIECMLSSRLEGKASLFHKWNQARGASGCGLSWHVKCTETLFMKTGSWPKRCGLSVWFFFLMLHYNIIYLDYWGFWHPLKSCACGQWLTLFTPLPALPFSQRTSGCGSCYKSLPVCFEERTIPFSRVGEEKSNSAVHGSGIWKEHEDRAWFQFLLCGCVTFSKSSNFSEPQAFHLQSWNNNINLGVWLWRLNEICISSGWHLINGALPNVCRANNQCQKCWSKDGRILYGQIAFSWTFFVISYSTSTFHDFCLRLCSMLDPRVGLIHKSFPYFPLCFGQASDKYLLHEWKARLLANNGMNRYKTSECGSA